jgi:aspartyl-tRNA(Asn)/glutamyl-tRNA(Gln) amidotransferase subunit C
MVKLSKDDVLKLAKLARLHLTDEEQASFKSEIESLLGYVEILKDVDLGDVKPTSQVTGLVNVMRKDEVVDYGVTPLELLKNAPSTSNNLIKVRRVL